MLIPCVPARGQSVGSIEEEVERGWKDAEHNLKETKNNLNDIMDTILAMMKASTDKPVSHACRNCCSVARCGVEGCYCYCLHSFQDETLANMRTQLKDAQAMVANIERLLEEKNEELGKVGFALGIVAAVGSCGL